MAPSPAPGRYTHLDFNAPLGEPRAAAVAQRLARADPATVFDLGCGWGELLLRVLAAAPKARGVGVDTDAELLARGRRNARARGLGDRVEFREEAASAPGPAQCDAALCVGSSHALGGTRQALSALALGVRPGGRILFGEAFWERPPTQADLEALWPGTTAEEFTDLPGLVDLAVAEGLRPLWIETADRGEWEYFESGILADREEWLLAHGDDPLAEEIRASAEGHRRIWLRGTRGLLGFAYLTLGVA
jgi:SAM-dependent methyltransferase